MQLLINTKSFFTTKLELREFILALEVPKKVILTVALPPSLLYYAFTLTKGNPNIKLASQDISTSGEGAFTGEENGALLRDLGATHVIIGHPETRVAHALLEEDIADKIEQAATHNLSPIIYIGSSFDSEGSTLEQILKLNLETIKDSKIKDCILVLESSEMIDEVRLTTLAKTIKQSIPKVEYKLLFAGGVDEETIQALKDKKYIDGFALSRNALDSVDRQKIYDSLD